MSISVQAQDLMREGMNPKPQRWAYNDASLTAEALGRVVEMAANLERYPKEPPRGVSVSAGACRQLLTFNRMPATATATDKEKGTLALTIAAFADFQPAWLAMAQRVDELLAQKDEVHATAEAARYGQCSLQTERGILCLRGNLVLEMQAQGAATTTGASPMTTLHDAMAGCDTYLAQHVVMRSQVRRPALLPREATPVELDAADAACQLTFPDPDALASAVLVQSGDKDAHDDALPAPTSLDPLGAHYSFQAQQQQQGHDPAAVEMTLWGAHPDTLYPGRFCFLVKVAGSK